MPSESGVGVLLACLVACGGEPQGAVVVPFETGDFQNVVKWEKPGSGVAIELRGEGNALAVHWEGDDGGHSKVTFRPAVLEPVLQEISANDQEPSEFVFRIRYEKDDLPTLGSYLFFDQSKTLRPFFFRLKQGSHEYSIQDDRLPRLHQVQIRGGFRAGDFIVEGILLRVRPKKTAR